MCAAQNFHIKLALFAGDWRYTMNRMALRAALAAVGMVWVLSASAQSNAPSYVGGSLGNSEYGDGLKLYMGAKITPVVGWEAQFTSLGTEHRSVGSRYTAYAVGGSAMARAPLAPAFSALGKLGVHYVIERRSAPASNGTDNSLALGVGVGLLWNFSHTGAMRMEIENIGGTHGDFFSVGLQFSF